MSRRIECPKCGTRNKAGAVCECYGGSRPASCSPSYYTFRNRDGQTIQLRGDLTMEDLVRMGYTDIRLAKPETPLKPNEWRADSIPENTEL